MNWYALGLAAASGGIAALIASLMFGKDPEKKTAYLTVVVVLFVVLNILSKRFILPELDARKSVSDIESALNEIPAYASIKTYEPAAYKNIVASLVDAKKKGYSQQQGIDLVKSQLSGLVKSKIPHASDEAILTYLGVMIIEIGELHRQGGGLCYKFLFPQVEAGIDFQKLLTPETQKRDLLALNEIIMTSNVKKVIPAGDEVMPSLNPIFASLNTKFGNDVAILENPTSAGVDREKVCSITMELYKQILALPSAQAASALRWMFGQQ